MDPHGYVTRVMLTLERDYQFVATYPDLPGALPIKLDEAAPLGGGRGPNPAALVATAVANCLASSLLFCVRKARVPIEHLSVSAEAHIARNAAGRYRLQHVSVSLAPVMAEGDVSRLQRCQQIYEDFCIVTAALREGIDVTVDLVPQPTVESQAS